MPSPQSEKRVGAHQAKQLPTGGKLRAQLQAAFRACSWVQQRLWAHRPARLRMPGRPRWPAGSSPRDPQSQPSRPAASSGCAPTGAKSTVSSPSAAPAARATARWPSCGGSKLPPKNATRCRRRVLLHLSIRIPLADARPAVARKRASGSIKSRRCASDRTSGPGRRGGFRAGSAGSLLHRDRALRHQREMGLRDREPQPVCRDCACSGGRDRHRRLSGVGRPGAGPAPAPAGRAGLLAALGFSLYLTCIEKYVLEVYCIYCVISLAIIASDLAAEPWVGPLQPGAAKRPSRKRLLPIGAKRISLSRPASLALINLN